MVLKTEAVSIWNVFVASDALPENLFTQHFYQIVWQNRRTLQPWQRVYVNVRNSTEEEKKHIPLLASKRIIYSRGEKTLKNGASMVCIGLFPYREIFTSYIVSMFLWLVILGKQRINQSKAPYYFFQCISLSSYIYITLCGQEFFSCIWISAIEFFSRTWISAIGFFFLHMDERWAFLAVKSAKSLLTISISF